jgi:hypothetical protein
MQPDPDRTSWNRALVLLLVLTIVLLLARPFPPVSDTPTPIAQAETEPAEAPEVVQLVPSPAPAIHTSLWWNEEIAQRDLDLVQAMGFRWIKQEFPWREIQTLGPASYNWWRSDRIVDDVEAHDLYMIVRLDRQPFWSQENGGWPPLENAPPADFEDYGRFCNAVASRYAGRIEAYQVWNEPNLAREWGGETPDPVEYTRLLKHCYEGIKAGDPDAIVISAGFAPTGTGPPEAMPDEEFIRAMYEAGAADYFDMLGVNAPGYLAPPHVSPEEAANTTAYGGHRWNAFRHVEDIRALMVEQGDGHKQIAILEMGWTTDPIHEVYSWFRVSEEQQADYLGGAYWWARLNWQPWIGIMTTIYIPDPYWTEENEEYWWAITLPTWPETKVRPAYDVLSGLPDWSDGFYDSPRWEQEEPAAP